MEKRREKREKSSFLGWYPTVRKEKKGCRERSSNFSLRSMKIGWSSSDGPRFKVEVLSEGYAWIPETSSFSKVSRGRFGKSKASGLGSVRGTSSGCCSHFKKYRFFLLWLFSILGAIWLSFNALQGLFCRFFPKGLFGKIMGYGNSAMF